VKNSAGFSIYRKVSELPSNWDDIAASNIFLRRDYLTVLERHAPENMQCFFIGITENDILVGVAVAQHLDFSEISTFGNRDNCIKNKIRTFFFKRFASRVLIIGNNMLTGHNSFRFISDEAAGISALYDAADSIAKSELKPHLVIWKDYEFDILNLFQPARFQSYYRFSTQPNMILPIRNHWKSENDYVADFLKKYRDQYKRARKKLAGIEKRFLTEDEINRYVDKLHELYLTVARNAPFNTFFLSKDHFPGIKANLAHRFLVRGYFDGSELIGFSTMIVNGRDIDTYFLGYDESHQKDRMLYLNMLYDMIAYAIENRFGKIVLARTALEIKSSAGAVPLKMYGFIRHRNPLINRFMSKLFSYFEPDLDWHQRHPFREQRLSSDAEES